MQSDIMEAPRMRAATPEDAHDLAMLIDIAGEGIPRWLWARSGAPGQDVLEIGAERARREAGGFSYRNARVAERDGGIAGMVLSYPIETAPEDDPDDLPAPIAPFVALEALSVGTWYINALAVRAASQGAGLGKALLAEAETQARQAGYARMSIQVYGQNHGAVALYHRVGYAETTRAPVRDHPCQPYYTGHVLLLEKALD